MISATDGHDGAAAGQDPLMRYVELRRHTDNEGDRLTPQGAAEAEMTGRDQLHPPYATLVSTGAVRATQMLEILRHAAGQDDTPITSPTGLWAPAGDRWRDAQAPILRGWPGLPTVMPARCCHGGMGSGTLPERGGPAMAARKRLSRRVSTSQAPPSAPLAPIE